MNARVRRILELLQQNVAIRRRRRDRLRLRHRAGHPARAVGEDQPGPVGREQLAPLDAHGFGHRQREGVAAGGRDEGERDARVAAGGLDQLLARGQHAPLLGVPDHRGADAALHRIGGVASLDLREDGRGRAVGDAIETHQRRAADGERIVDEPGHMPLPSLKLIPQYAGAGSAFSNRRWRHRPARASSPGCDRRRARVAADARVARVVQRVNEQIVLGDVRANVVTAPVVERRQLVAARAAIFAERLEVPPLPALRPAQAVDQHGRALRLQVSEQRRLLSHPAAFGLAGDAGEQLAPVKRLLLFGRRRRVERHDVQSVTAHVLVPHLQGLEEVVAGVDEQDLVGQPEPMEEVHQHHRRLLHARQQHDVVPQRVDRPANPLKGAQRFQRRIRRGAINPRVVCHRAVPPGPRLQSKIWCPLYKTPAGGRQRSRYGAPCQRSRLRRRRW